MATETICPECGHSPVSGESCVKCGARFDFVPVYLRAQERHGLTGEDPEEQTNIATALPDAVTTHPYAAASMFGVAAVAFGAEGAGVLGRIHEDTFLLVLAGLYLAIGIGIGLRLGLLRGLGYIVVPFHIGLILWIGRRQPLHPAVIAGVLFPLATLVGMVKEPGALRRAAGLMLAVGVLFMRAFITVAAPPPDDRAELRKAGGTLTLPPGFQFLVLPADRKNVPLPVGSSRAMVCFASGQGDSVGFLVIEPRAPGETGEDAAANYANRLAGELGFELEGSPLDFAPGALGRAPHASYAFQSNYRGVARQGILIAVQASSGRMVGAAYMVPYTMGAVLRAGALRVFSSVSFESAADR
jgi:hypothetical protein